MSGPDQHREWKTLGQRSLIQTPWFEVSQADVELPDGRRIDHYLFRVPPVVLTAMLDDHPRGQHVGRRADARIALVIELLRSNFSEPDATT